MLVHAWFEEGYGLAWGDLDSALAAARRGEETGFAELWHALHPLLLRYLRAVVGDAAEDVASETWLQAAKDVRGYRGDAAGFRVWLFRVARHRALDELRKASRRKEDNGDVAEYVTDWPAPDDTERAAAEREDTERALRLIARLPKDQAEAVLLRVVAGMDVAQTAKVLDKRDGAVRIAAMRGLKRLAAILAEQQADGDTGHDTGTTGSTGATGSTETTGSTGTTGNSGANGGMEGAGDAGPGRNGRGSRTVKGAEYG
ncbi:RNA polymerase sigma-70 factor (ECF subfamily) [Catenulispora sp. MAP12-49]|uniref:RNA polymerase sigma factor n=1 Tax=Catenulispora sp. MAP12-49 TaxID=3156302 RepID=UPI00351719E2